MFYCLLLSALIFFITTLLLPERHIYTLKRKLRKSGEKELTLIFQHRVSVRSPSLYWKLAFNIPPRSLTSSPRITFLHAGSVGGQKGLGWALLVPLTLVLPSQLVHQVGFAGAVEAHDSHHHNGLLNGRQDLQSFRINQQSPISVLDEALWAWHVDLWGHVPLSAGEEMGWIRISGLSRSRAFTRLFCIQKEES